MMRTRVVDGVPYVRITDLIDEMERLEETEPRISWVFKLMKRFFIDMLRNAVK